MNIYKCGIKIENWIVWSYIADTSMEEALAKFKTYCIKQYPNQYNTAGYIIETQQ